MNHHATVPSHEPPCQILIAPKIGNHLITEQMKNGFLCFEIQYFLRQHYIHLG
jgi:hypothetical protein